MKVCAVCGASASVAASSCGACGEGSWQPFVAPAAPVPVEAKKAAKKSKKVQPVVESVAEPVAEPVAGDITDEDFAAEIAQASDADLLSLLGESSAMSPSWRALLLAEIDKRGEA